jgi:hypothetical protein
MRDVRVLMRMPLAVLVLLALFPACRERQPDMSSYMAGPNWRANWVAVAVIAGNEAAAKPAESILVRARIPTFCEGSICWTVYVPRTYRQRAAAELRAHYHEHIRFVRAEDAP